MIDHDPVWCGFTLVAFTTSGRTQAYMYTTLDALCCTLHTHTTRFQSCSTVRQILQSWSSNHCKLQLHEKFFGRSAFFGAPYTASGWQCSQVFGGAISAFAATSTWPRARTTAASAEQRSALTRPDLRHCWWLFRFKQMKIVYASQGGRIRHRLALRFSA